MERLWSTRGAFSNFQSPCGVDSRRRCTFYWRAPKLVHDVSPRRRKGQRSNRNAFGL